MYKNAKCASNSKYANNADDNNKKTALTITSKSRHSNY